MLTIVVGRGEGGNGIRRGTGRTREDSKGRERRDVERTRRRCWIDRQWHRRRAQEGNSAARTSVSNCERPFLSTSWCLAGSASSPSLPHPDSCRLAANGHWVSQQHCIQTATRRLPQSHHFLVAISTPTLNPRPCASALEPRSVTASTRRGPSLQVRERGSQTNTRPVERRAPRPASLADAAICPEEQPRCCRD